MHARAVAPGAIETLEFGGVRARRGPTGPLAAELLANPTARSRELAEATRPVTEDARYRERLAAAVARGNAKLARVERIKSFVILPRDFSQEAGELTPTMKMKRGVIEANYRGSWTAPRRGRIRHPRSGQRARARWRS